MPFSHAPSTPLLFSFQCYLMNLSPTFNARRMLRPRCVKKTKVSENFGNLLESQPHRYAVSSTHKNTPFQRHQYLKQHKYKSHAKNTPSTTEKKVRIARLKQHMYTAHVKQHTQKYDSKTVHVHRTQYQHTNVYRTQYKHDSVHSTHYKHAKTRQKPR